MWVPFAAPACSCRSAACLGQQARRVVQWSCLLTRRAAFPVIHPDSSMRMLHAAFAASSLPFARCWRVCWAAWHRWLRLRSMRWLGPGRSVSMSMTPLMAHVGMHWEVPRRLVLKSRETRSQLHCTRKPGLPPALPLLSHSLVRLQRPLLRQDLSTRTKRSLVFWRLASDTVQVPRRQRSKQLRIGWPGCSHSIEQLRLLSWAVSWHMWRASIRLQVDVQC